MRPKGSRGIAALILGFPKRRSNAIGPPRWLKRAQAIKGTPRTPRVHPRAVPAPGASAIAGRTATTAEFCCVLGFAGMPALPALLGRGNHLAGPSGFWVGHSSERFAVELMSDREPGPCARLPGNHVAGVDREQ